jgi:hypothetical protein
VASFFLLGPLKMVKNALVLRHFIFFFKIEEKLNRSENKLYKATITLILKEKKHSSKPTLFYQLSKLI